MLRKASCGNDASLAGGRKCQSAAATLEDDSVLYWSESLVEIPKL